jgi:hypothetical protein
VDARRKGKDGLLGVVEGQWDAEWGRTPGSWEMMIRFRADELARLMDVRGDRIVVDGLLVLVHVSME